MGNTINRRVLVLSVLLMVAALVLMSAIGLEDAQAAAKKVTLCHDAGKETQKTIKVSKKQAKKHLAHGDTRGKCTPLPPQEPAPEEEELAPSPSNCNQPPAYSGESSAWGWGQNDHGQVGDGTYLEYNWPVGVRNLSGLQTVAAGGTHSLALKEDCTVVAWGYNSDGQLGDGTTTDQNTPVQVANLGDGLDIAAGNSHSLALKTDGTVWAWGYNSDGQLGDGTTTERHTPVQVKDLSGVKAISAGGHHSLALKEDGTVWAWGSNYAGQLGDGSTTNRNTPVQVKGEPPTNAPAGSSSAAFFPWDTWDNNLSGVKAISAGGDHSLALMEDGTVRSWGYNRYGSLGDGTTTNRHTPVQVQNLGGVKAISAGGSHSLALMEDGTVRSWGWNGFGQLGNGTFGGDAPNPTPVQVQNLGGVKAIDAGDGHSLALKEDGTVFAWGYNGHGQLGNNRGHPHEKPDYETARYTPAQAIGLDDVEAIAAGGNHSLAIVVKPPVAQQ